MQNKNRVVITVEFTGPQREPTTVYIDSVTGCPVSITGGVLWPMDLALVVDVVEAIRSRKDKYNF